MEEKLYCPECRCEVGGDSGVDPYKHCIHCFNCVPGRPSDMVKHAKKLNSEYARRMELLLSYCDTEPAEEQKE